MINDNLNKRYKNPVSCVYKISIKKYVYIGSTKIFIKRKGEHLWNLKNNKHTNPILQNLYNKYGEEKIKFSIVEEVSIENLQEIEQKYIDDYKLNKKLKLINILLVAGSNLGHKQSKETCNKKRISMIGKNKGKKRSPEDSLKKSIRQKGRIIDKEWRNKISKSLKGKPSPNKPKKFIEYSDKIYTYKEFSILVNCDLSTLYTTKKEYLEKKYNCKILH
jgi:group I intron endonuclease